LEPAVNQAIGQTSPASPATSSIPEAHASGPSIRRRGASRGVAFTGFSLILVLLFASSAAPSPFFVVYQAEWGFPSWWISFAFAVYAVTLLVALLTVGSLSDHIGRRPVLIGALAFQAAAMVLFAFAPSIGTVVLARAIQGFATGAATGAFSAALTDLAPANNRALGATISGLSSVGGLAIGAILAGVSIEAEADPIVGTFLALAAVFILGLAFVVVSPESVTPRAGALRSLRPHVAIPARARGEFGMAVPVLLAEWMTGGLFLGLVPEILRDVFHVDSGLVSGGTIAALSLVGAVSIFLSRRAAARTVVIAGSFTLLLGVGAVAASFLLASIVLLAVGTVVAGVGFGITFAAELRLIAPLAEAHQRGEMFAAIYVVAYLSFGVPAIVAGAAASIFHLVPTAIAYTLVVVLSATVGTLVHLARARRAEAGVRAR
jgi:MFS family permease